MIRLLTAPSSYHGNPRGYAMNQAGHAVLGAAWIALGWPLWAWLAVYVAWEAVQVAAFDGTLWDSIEDAAFAGGGGLAALHGWPVAAVLAAFFASGVARRFHERANG